MWVTSHAGSVGWGFWDLRKSSELSSCLGRRLISELGEARRICALRAPRVGWVESWRCKSSQHRKIVGLSPHVEKSFNSKVIKFRTWTKFVNVMYFGFLYMFMNILWTLCLFHTSVSWVCYIYLYLSLSLSLSLIYIYIYIYGEMVDFGKFDKMRKISGYTKTLTTDLTMIFRLYEIFLK